MTSSPLLPAPASTRAPSHRDGAVDLVRVVLLGAVVLLHALMAGVALDASGGPILVNAMDGWSGFGPLSWFVQIMPLFFVLGGFSARVQWTRRQASGGDWAGYVNGRMRRLLRPALPAFVATAALLLGLHATGAADLAGIAGFRVGQPFWFLGVYLGVTALVPVMSLLHDRRPAATFALLAGGAFAVDLVRVGTGVDAIGLLNMAFVWLLMQQLGFALADGAFDRIPALAKAALGGAALAAAGVLTAVGLGAGDMYGALNPPMGVLALLGVAQVMAFLIARPVLRRVAAVPVVARAVSVVGARSMTVYSWHMLVIVALSGILLLLPIELPALLSDGWWASRPLWFAVVLLAVGLMAAAAGGSEARRERDTTTTSRTAAAATAAVGVAAVIMVLAAGVHPWAWFGCAAVIAILLARPSRALPLLRAALPVPAALPIPAAFPVPAPAPPARRLAA